VRGGNGTDDGCTHPATTVAPDCPRRRHIRSAVSTSNSSALGRWRQVRERGRLVGTTGAMASRAGLRQRGSRADTTLGAPLVENEMGPGAGARRLEVSPPPVCRVDDNHAVGVADRASPTRCGGSGATAPGRADESSRRKHAEGKGMHPGRGLPFCTRGRPSSAAATPGSSRRRARSPRGVRCASAVHALGAGLVPCQSVAHDVT